MLNKLLKRRDFEEVYNILEKSNFSYSLNNLVEVFPKCDSMVLYVFLMYSISKEETVEKHITLCECLRYINPYIYESNIMIRWHIMQALTIDKTSVKVMSWVIETYATDPSSPFSKDEIYYFAKNVLDSDKSNIIANKILNNQG